MVAETFTIKVASKEHSGPNPTIQDPTVSENSDGSITVSWEELGDPGTGILKTKFAVYSANGTLISTSVMDGSNGWDNLNDGDDDVSSQTITLEGGGSAHAYLKYFGNFPLPNLVEFWLEFTPRILTVAFADDLTEGSDADLVISVTRPFESDVTLSIELIEGSLSASELENLPSGVVLPAGSTSIAVPFHIKQNPAATVNPETFTINVVSAKGNGSVQGAVKEFVSVPYTFTKTDGEFLYSKSADRMEANGTVTIGRTDGNSALIRLSDGAAHYNAAQFALSSASLVYAEIANLGKPLLKGTFAFSYAAPSTTALTESAKPSDAFQLAGFDITYKALSVLPNAVGADVVFSLPFTLGSINIDTSLFKPLLINQSGLIFDSTGVSLGFSAEVQLPDPPELLVFGVFTAKVSSVALSYQQSADLLKLQGKFSVTNLLALRIESVTIDFSGNNFIQFQAGKADFVGTLTIQAVKATDPLHAGFGLESLSLSLNTIAKTISGSAAITMPFGGRSPTGSVTLEGSWANGPTITKIGLGVDGLQVVLGNTPIFWQSASIEVKNFFDPAQATEYTGSLGFSFGPRVQGAALATLDVAGAGSKAKLTGTTVDFKILPYSAIDVATFGTGLFKDLQHLFPVVAFKGTSVVNYDPSKQTLLDFQFTGQTNIFGGFISETVSRSFIADKDLNFTFSGKTMVNLSIPLLDKSFAGGSVEVPYQVVYKNNDTFDDDYVAIWLAVRAGVGPLVANFTVSAKLFFDGHYQTNLGPPPAATAHAPALGGSGLVAAQIAGPEWLLLNAAWENQASGPISVRIINPQGQAFGEVEFASNAIAVVDQLTTGFSKTVVVFNPGTSVGWRIEVVDPTGLGAVTTIEALPTAPLDLGSVDIVQVNPDGTVSLSYTASGPFGASLEFFADQNGTFFNGMPLGGTIAAEEGSGNWIGSLDLSEGIWRVYGMLSDGTNVPDRVYASEALVVAADGTMSIGNPVSIDPAFLAQAEGTVTSSAFTFTISLAHASSATETVTWSVAPTGQHPVSTTDFAENAFPGDVVTFSAGETTKTIVIAVAADTLIEADEGFVVTLSNPSANLVLGRAEAIGTIQDDDVVVSTVSIATLSAAKAEGDSGATTFAFTVSLDQASPSPQTIDWTVASTDDHPALASDFVSGVLPSGTLAFTPGETSATITVSAAGDAIVEFDEFFTVMLSNPSAGLSLGTATAIGIIQNDDRARISIAPLAASKPEGNGSTTAFSFTVSLDQASFAAQTAEWTVTGTGGNAADGADFGGVAPTGTVSFAAGETSAVVTIVVTGDAAAELNEEFTVTLSNPTFGLLLGTALATGTILNDDRSVVSVTAGPGAKAEGSGGTSSFTWTVSLDRAGVTSQTVAWAITGGGAHAADGADLAGGVLPTGTLTFAPGETVKTVTVDVAGDTTVEFTEGVMLTLSAPSSGLDFGTATMAGTIVNDDLSVVSIAAQSVSKAEGNSGTTAFTFTVTLSQGGVSSQTVDWKVTGSGANPADTADFGGALPAGTVTFGAGETSKVVTIQVAGDSGGESHEAFLVSLSNLSAGLELGTATASGTILDDDGSVSIAAVQPAAMTEGNSGGTKAFTFTVTTTGDASTTRSVAWAVTGTGASKADAADFVGGVLPTGTLTFATGETSKELTITVNGDATVEPDEGFLVGLSNPSSGLKIGTGSASGTIQNDDSPTVTVTAHDDAYIVLEGQSLTIASASGVLSNDQSASSATLLANASHGAAQLAGTGAFTYTPAASFTGIDSFTYHAVPGGNGVDGKAVLYVVPVNTGASTTLDLLGLTAAEQIAATYTAFFGRAADAGGHGFWVGEFIQHLPSQGAAALFANIASSFGISAEAKALYPFLANPFGASDAQISAFLDSVYNNLFNRSSDAGGLAYWTGEIKATLQAGKFVGSVLVNIMSGAQDTAAGKDITTLMGKVAVSLEFVREQQEHGTIWTGASDVAAAKNLLDPVTADPLSVLVGVRNAEMLIAGHV